MKKKAKKTTDKHKRRQRAHAKRRAMERFGIQMNRQDYWALLRKVQKGDGIVIERQEAGRMKYAVIWEDKVIPLIYDKTSKTIVTVLPVNELGWLTDFLGDSSGTSEAA